MRRVALFGGSFDPPHIGHVLAVKYILATQAISEVLIVPVHQHAFHKELTDFDIRIRLVELAFSDDPRVVVSRIEEELPAPNYTLHTVRALRARDPDLELRLVVGADVLNDLDKWHNIEELVAEAPLLVLGRAGVRHADAPRVFLPDVSSTEIRTMLRSRGPQKISSLIQLSELLPQNVLQEIVTCDWYR